MEGLAFKVTWGNNVPAADAEAESRLGRDLAGFGAVGEFSVVPAKTGN